MNFQVLVEPDGTTGSYILFEKNTLTPIATINKAGQQINIIQGQVSITNAPLPPDVQKLINDVFTLKFTETLTPNPSIILPIRSFRSRCSRSSWRTERRLPRSFCS